MRLSAALCSNSPPFRLLFCHGLGSAKADAQSVQEWATSGGVRRGAFQFQMIKYTDYGRAPGQPWTVDCWAEDIAVELCRQKRTVAVCASAGAQAFLRAVHRSPSLLQNISALLMISPGVGMEVDNYVRRVLPAHSEALQAGLSVPHPSSDKSVKISIDLASLEDYHQNCILRLDRPLPLFEFPVIIVHGIHDKLVPFANSVALLDKLRVRNKALFLVNSGHLISEKSTLLYALDSIWEAMVAKEEAVEEEGERWIGKI